MNATSTAPAAADEAAAQDAAAEAPDAPAVPTTPAKKRAAKKADALGVTTVVVSKGGRRKPTPKNDAAIAPTMREVTVDGETVRVAIGLSDDDAVKYAKRMIADAKARKSGEANGKETPDVERKPAARKASTRKAAPKVPAGKVRLTLRKIAYQRALMGDNDAANAFRKANPAIAKALKATPATSVGGAGATAYFAVVSIEQGALIGKHLVATAKAWGKMDKPVGNPKALVNNASRVNKEVADAAK